MNTQPTSNTKDTEAVNPVQRRSERTRGGRGSGRKPLARTDGQDTPGTSVTAADVTPAAQEDTTGKLTLPPLPATPPRSGRRPDGGQVLTPSVAPKDAKQSRVGRSPVSHLAQKAGENLTKTPADAKAVVEARKGGKDAVADEAVGTAEADAEQDGEDVGKMVGTKDAGKPGGDEDLFGDLDNERDRKAEASNGNDDEATQDEGEDVDDADDDTSDVTEGELEDATDEAVEALSLEARTKPKQYLAKVGKYHEEMLSAKAAFSKLEEPDIDADEYFQLDDEFKEAAVAFEAARKQYQGAVLDWNLTNAFSWNMKASASPSVRLCVATSKMCLGLTRVCGKTDKTVRICMEENCSVSGHLQKAPLLAPDSLLMAEPRQKAALPIMLPSPDMLGNLTLMTQKIATTEFSTTSTMLVPKVLETISREWDDECPDLLLPDDPDHLLQWAPTPSPQQS
mmetsp:Transcript_14719/g.42395  ORF Transcript_14719/g.42395 Transcript_14719/m.42395 type:complete len:453 (-) Transcript_14719:350-1708(-)